MPEEMAKPILRSLLFQSVYRQYPCLELPWLAETMTFPEWVLPLSSNCPMEVIQ